MFPETPNHLPGDRDLLLELRPLPPLRHRCVPVLSTFPSAFWTLPKIGLPAHGACVRDRVRSLQTDNPTMVDQAVRSNDPALIDHRGEDVA